MSKEKLGTIVVLDFICTALWSILVIMFLFTGEYATRPFLFFLYCFCAIVWCLAAVKQKKRYNELYGKVSEDKKADAEFDSLDKEDESMVKEADDTDTK